MGRARLKLELIPKKGARILKFNNKKESLKKKLDELKILCGVDACMITYGPDQEHRAAEVYPSDDLHRTFQIIDDYCSKKDDPTKCERFGLPDFFEERAKKAEEDLAKLRKQNMNAKYPIPREMIDQEKDPFVLREFANQLLAKSQNVKSRIENLKRMNQVPLSDNGSEYYRPVLAPPPPQSFTNLLMGNLNDDNGGGDYVFPDAAVNSPVVNVIDQNQSGGDYYYPESPVVNVIDQNQSGGDYYYPEADPFVMENDEGNAYLLPFY